MDQNKNQLISKLFRGNFSTKKHCCSDMKFLMAKLITKGRRGWTNLTVECEKTTTELNQTLSE